MKGKSTIRLKKSFVEASSFYLFLKNLAPFYPIILSPPPPPPGASGCATGSFWCAAWKCRGPLPPPPLRTAATAEAAGRARRESTHSPWRSWRDAASTRTGAIENVVYILKVITVILFFYFAANPQVREGPSGVRRRRGPGHGGPAKEGIRRGTGIAISSFFV